MNYHRRDYNQVVAVPRKCQTQAESALCNYTCINAAGAHCNEPGQDRQRNTSTQDEIAELLEPAAASGLVPFSQQAPKFSR